MTRNVLQDRESAFEYEFFHRVDQQLLQQLREKLQSEERRKALVEHVGIENEAVIDKLIELDISVETVLALTLVPLVRVAWADGDIADAERKAILDAAETMGHSPGSPSFQLLNAWLDENPGDPLYTTWKQYFQAIYETMQPETKAVVQTGVLDRARKVAEAAGGVLGLKRINPEEHAVLNELQTLLK